jgi:hypothetical protein
MGRGSNDVMPSADVIKKYMDDLESGALDASQAAQAISTLKKNAEKEHNINFGVLKLTRKLKNMGESDRTAWFRHLIHYSRSMGLLEQQDMFDDVSSDDLEEELSPQQQRDLDAAEFEGAGLQ